MPRASHVNPLAMQAGRDVVVALRSGSDAVNPVAFFVLSVTVFGLGMREAGEVGIGVIWVLALFAALLASESLFRRDEDDGSLEQMLLHARPLFLAVLGKLLAHWVFTGFLMVLLSPLAAWMLNVPTMAIAVLAGGLLLGTPVFTLIGAIGAALTIGTGRGGLLIAILVVPFHVPVLLFGIGAATAAANGQDPMPHFLWLAALFAGSLTLVPFVVAKALRISQEY